MAALWVGLAHVMIWSGGHLPIWAAPKLGVDLFMVISGFVMAHQATLRDRDEPLGDFRNWGRFYLRRLLRIAPLYYAVLVLGALSAPLFFGGYQILFDRLGFDEGAYFNPANNSFDVTTLVMRFSFLFGFSPTQSFQTMLPDWSIALEMQFYLAFPALWVVVQRIGLAWGVAIFAAPFALIASLGPWGFEEPSLLVLKAHFLLAGLLFFGAWREGLWPIRLLYALLGALLCATDMLLPLTQNWPAAALGLVFACLAFSRPNLSGPAAVLSRFCADHSYGFYLLHGFWIAACGWLLAAYPSLDDNNWVWRSLMASVVVAGAMMSSVVMRRLIELPVLKRRSILLRPRDSGTLSSHTPS